MWEMIGKKQNNNQPEREETKNLPLAGWRFDEIGPGICEIAKELQNRESECEKRSAKKQNNNTPKREEMKKLTNFELTNEEVNEYRKRTAWF